MSSTTPIPSSPIPQPPPKIGTRYVIVDSDIDGVGASWTGRYAWLERADAEQHKSSGSHIYMLLDPSDAAELEMLRKVEDEAATNMKARALWDDDGTIVVHEDWEAFHNARAARIAFEKKIGGGV
jgi:hypothetical protein